MKTLLSIVLLTVCLVARSQDKIITHQADTVVCKISELTDHLVVYTLPGEQVLNSMPKNLVAEIRYGNGRMQPISKKLVVNGAADWANVQITSLPSDVEGLVRKGELMANAGNGWAGNRQSKTVKKAMDKLRKEAAAMNSPIVLLMTTEVNSNYRSSGTTASIIGIAYGY